MNLILLKTWEHVELTLTAMFFSMLFAVPCGVFLARVKGKKLPSVVIRLVAMIQTIPGLALLALTVALLAMLRNYIPVSVTGVFPAVIVLSLYALLPIVSSTYSGIQQVSPSVKNVAHAMGMKPIQVLFYVEIPLSLPVLMMGLRTALVSIVGMATLTSLVGSGGLGDLIIQGLKTMQVGLVVAGTLPAAALAIVFDSVLSQLTRWIVPDF